MTFRRERPGLAGFLTLAALGVTALAPNAQAASPEFFINKKPALHATISAAPLGNSFLLIGGYNAEIRCGNFSVLKGLITSSTRGELELLYEECEIFQTTKLEPYLDCEILGGHLTFSSTILPAEILGTNAPAILFEKISTKMEIHEPHEEFCNLPENPAFKGELCLAVDSNNTIKPLVLSSSAIQGTCKPRQILESLGQELTSGGVTDKFLLGAQTVNLDATMHLLLTGAHEGLTLGAGLEEAPPPPLNTTLCKVKTGSCEPYALGTKLSAGLENEVKFVFLHEGEKREPPCKVSTLSGVTTKEGKSETPIIGEITALSFEECGAGLCTITSLNLPYKFEAKATSEGNGTMTWSSGGSGSPSFSINCLGLTKCIYGAATMSFSFTGGTPAKLSNSGVALKRETGSEEACGESGAEWKGVAAAEGKIFYKITSPSPLFVRLV